jgi:flagellar hook assembly protein FlgD
VQLDILDATGRVVRRLLDRWVPAGPRAAAWDGRDGGGRALPSGIYVVRMRADRWSAARKIALVR